MWSGTCPQHSCSTVAGKNAVHSRGGDINRWPTRNTLGECRELCRTTGCSVYTWHSAAFGGSWARRCVTWTQGEAQGAGRAAPNSWISQGGMFSGQCNTPATGHITSAGCSLQVPWWHCDQFKNGQHFGADRWTSGSPWEDALNKCEYLMHKCNNARNNCLLQDAISTCTECKTWCDATHQFYR